MDRKKLKKGLIWAKSYRHLTVEDRRTVSYLNLTFFISVVIVSFPILNIFFQVCFSDESTFRVLSDKSQCVKRKPDENFHQNCVIKTVKRHLRYDNIYLFNRKKQIAFNTKKEVLKKGKPTEFPVYWLYTGVLYIR